MQLLENQLNKNIILINNYIPENLRHLIKLENSSMDEFGVKFDLNRGMISQYIRKLAIPKLETIQKICLYFEISIDDFVNKELSKSSLSSYVQSNKEPAVNEAAEGYGYVSLKYVELLEKSIEDKDKIIKALESKVDPDKSKTA